MGNNAGKSNGDKMIKRLIAAFLILAALYLVSTFMSAYTYNTDFPAYYRAANVVLDRDVPIIDVYDLEAENNKYNIPEAFVIYKYSILVAYVMSPLAMLPYYSAKALMIALDILAYGCSMLIILRLTKASGRSYLYPLAFSFLWMPFIHDVRFVQVNSILLFLITLSVYFATRNQPCISGSLLGLAALFKIYPLIIAVIFGIKNWRIALSCAVIFCLALLFPGTKEWFSAFAYTPFIEKLYSVVYTTLIHYSITLYGLYVVLIGGITALTVYQRRESDYLYLTALLIPAILLIMTVNQYFYLVLLVIPYTLLLFNHDLKIIYKITAIISFILIYLAGFLFPFNYYANHITICGMMLLWIVLIFNRRKIIQ
jgi:hypothetical protein